MTINYKTHRRYSIDNFNKHNTYGGRKAHYTMDYNTYNTSSLYINNPVAYRCIQILSHSISSIKWEVMNGNVKLTSHPLVDLLQKPNGYDSWNTLIQKIVIHMLVFGNAYVYRPHPTLIKDICVLHPEKVRIVTDENDNIKKYEYCANRGRNISINNPINVLHLRYFNITNELQGTSLLHVAKKAIMHHEAMSDHNISILKNGGRPSGCLIVRTKYGLTNEQRINLRASIKELYEGPTNAGRIFVAEGDFEWKEIGFAPKDMDFTNGKILAAREIAMVFGVPFPMLGLHDATYANYQEAREHFWQDTILPYLTYIIAEFNKWLVCDIRDTYYTYSNDSLSKLKGANHE